MRRGRATEVCCCWQAQSTEVRGAGCGEACQVRFEARAARRDPPSPARSHVSCGVSLFTSKGPGSTAARRAGARTRTATVHPSSPLVICVCVHAPLGFTSHSFLRYVWPRNLVGI